MFLSEVARCVHLLCRGGDLTESMSQYLITRLENILNVKIELRLEGPRFAARKCSRLLHRESVDREVPRNSGMCSVCARVQPGYGGRLTPEYTGVIPGLKSELAQAIRDALAVPDRPGIRVIAKQFGVSPMTRVYDVR
jgi:hypothetical protein